MFSSIVKLNSKLFSLQVLLLHSMYFLHLSIYHLPLVKILELYYKIKFRLTTEDVSLSSPNYEMTLCQCSTQRLLDTETGHIVTTQELYSPCTFRNKNAEIFVYPPCLMECPCISNRF